MPFGINLRSLFGRKAEAQEAVSMSWLQYIVESVAVHVPPNRNDPRSITGERWIKLAQHLAETPRQPTPSDFEAMSNNASRIGFAILRGHGDEPVSLPASLVIDVLARRDVAATASGIYAPPGRGLRVATDEDAIDQNREIARQLRDFEAKLSQFEEHRARLLDPPCGRRAGMPRGPMSGGPQ